MLVFDKMILDTLLQSKWGGMKDGLATSDINGAVAHFDPRSQERYREIYSSLAAEFPQLVANMEDIEMIVAKDNYAQYRIRRNETLAEKESSVTYYIYFTIDQNGL